MFIKLVFIIMLASSETQQPVWVEVKLNDKSGKSDNRNKQLATSRNVPWYSNLDEDDQLLFRAAYDSPYGHEEYEEEEILPVGKLDLLKDGMWAIKAKIKEMKTFNKALAANLLATKLQVKALLAKQLKTIKMHHHIEIEKKKPAYDYQSPQSPPPAYPQYEPPQYAAPAHHYEPPHYATPAPQYEAPQYTAPAAQYEPYYAAVPAPQYEAHQYGAPQYGPPQYAHDPYYGH